MNIIYIQCDMRYNKWLLSELVDKSVIEHTLSRAKEIPCENIIAGVYACDENMELVEVLKANGVNVVLSDEEDVNKRFLDLMTSEKMSDVKYIVRIGGDQVLLDADNMKKVLGEMDEQEAEWFYESSIGGVWSDVVKVDYLRKHKEELTKEQRYFNAIERIGGVRYKLPILPAVAFSFRVNCEEGLRICKHMLSNELDVYKVSGDLMQRLSLHCGYLVKTGLWGSWLLANKCDDFFYDENGEVNPWWGSCVVNLVKERLKTDIRVFEWGAGNSTLFWNARAKEVVSVEHDKIWYQKMKEMVLANVKLEYCELEYGGRYSEMILEEEEPFDVVLVDGRDRVRCAKNAVKKLKENGIIIWDNSDREYYSEGYEYLKQRGFKELKLGGVVYGLPAMEDVTSIFYREDNLMGL